MISSLVICYLVSTPSLSSVLEVATILFAFIDALELSPTNIDDLHNAGFFFLLLQGSDEEGADYVTAQHPVAVQPQRTPPPALARRRLGHQVYTLAFNYSHLD